MARAVWTTAVLLVTLANPAGADPVALRAGFVTFTDEPGAFAFTGPGVDIEGEWFPIALSGISWFDRCYPSLCSPGARVDFGTTTYAVRPDDTGSSGRGTIDGTTYDVLFFDAQLTFHGPEVVAPAGQPEGPLVASGPFEFEGRIQAYSDALTTRPPVFAGTFRGSGLADVFFGFERATPPGYLLTDLVYRFDQPTPIPEPSTLVLLSTALAAGGVGLRRRRSRLHGNLY